MEEDSFFQRTGQNPTMNITLKTNIQVDKEKYSFEKLCQKMEQRAHKIRKRNMTKLLVIFY